MLTSSVVITVTVCWIIRDVMEKTIVEMGPMNETAVRFTFIDDYRY